MSNLDQQGVMVVVELGKDLLNHFSIPQWNAFVDDLKARSLIPTCWAGGERPPPITVDLNFRHLQRVHYRMDGIDLSLCYLDHANFTQASLKKALLGSGKDISYRGARLHGASFQGQEITGCDFTDSQGVEPAQFEEAYYDPDNPPKGLPPEVLAVCEGNGDESATLPRRPSSPDDKSIPTESPLRASVTIQHIPME